jgi:hypothetical protein
VSALAVSLPATIGAQTAGAVSGSVTTEANRPLAGAIVVLDDAVRQRSETDSLGRFRLAGVSAGRHRLTVVRIGYSPGERIIDVPASGLEVTITLRRITTLDTVPIRASRTGVLGIVVTRGRLQPIAGAAVTAMGSTQTRPTATTTANGRFDVPMVKPGAYMLRAMRAGYQTRELAVLVPDSGAIEVVIALDSMTGTKFEKMHEQDLADQNRRLSYRVPSNSAFVPGYELPRIGRMSLSDALRYAPAFLTSGITSLAGACVYVDGVGKRGLSTDDIDASEVDAVEVYGPRALIGPLWLRNELACSGAGARKVGLQPNGGSSRREQASSRAAVVVVWMRK